MVKLTDGNILYTFMVIDGLGDCYAWYLSCNYQTIHCLVIGKDLLTTETEEIQVFEISTLKQQNSWQAKPTTSYLYTTQSID